MARHDDPRFRITVWPSDLPPPPAVAVPRLLGYALPGEKFPRDIDGNYILPGTGKDMPRLWEALKLSVDSSSAGNSNSKSIELGEGFELKEVNLSDLKEFTSLSIFFDERQMEARSLPEEFFMREFLEIDPNASPDNFMNFIADWGPLVFPSHLLQQREVAEISPRSDIFSQSAPDPFDVSLRPTSASEHRTEVYDELWEILRAAEEEGEEISFRYMRNPNGEPMYQSWTGFSFMVQHALLTLYQAVFESWTAILNVAEPGVIPDINAAVPDYISEIWTKRAWPAPDSYFDLFDTLADILSSATSVVGPRIELVNDKLEQTGFAYGRPLPRLLVAMSVQALGYAASGIPARRCANETCGRWFTRQRGRSEYGQKRKSGVIYCSATCARAQAQRLYRRRKSSRVTD